MAPSPCIRAGFSGRTSKNTTEKVAHPFLHVYTPVKGLCGDEFDAREPHAGSLHPFQVGECIHDGFLLFGGELGAIESNTWDEVDRVRTV